MPPSGNSWGIRDIIDIRCYIKSWCFAAILALPPGRTSRQRTSGRTAAERWKWISEPADYTITIAPSNLPEADVSLGN
jgi:hypothetical protein